VSLSMFVCARVLRRRLRLRWIDRIASVVAVVVVVAVVAVVAVVSVMSSNRFAFDSASIRVATSSNRPNFAFASASIRVAISALIADRIAAYFSSIFTHNSS